MSECVKCGIEDSRALLFDVISKEGIVKICRKCNLEEDFPMIKTVRKDPIIEEKKGVYERLSGYAGIDPEKHKRRFEIDKKEELVKKQNTSLRDIIDRNFKEKVVKDKNPELKSDLIHNFHWVIMRARRAKKLTQSQFAHKLQVPEEAIRTIEQGIVPQGSEQLILRIENYLGINVSEDAAHGGSFGEDFTKTKVKEQFDKEVVFDKFTTKNLTISDLKGMEKKEDQTKIRHEEFLDPFQKDDKKKLREETDLSEEEIDKLIYGY